MITTAIKKWPAPQFSFSKPYRSDNRHAALAILIQISLCLALFSGLDLFPTSSRTATRRVGKARLPSKFLLRLLSFWDVPRLANARIRAQAALISRLFVGSPANSKVAS